ncbi:ribonuclease J [Candidatus Dojkabacteria bacterium]|uniref:Ribonuclease J n=1 Tax=Candidatus Dojkabacteria bacterium TaxID=2099670 RepID=A0A955L860_9BACT|nr:ribonuclease J [Candidatus Dojkabacteria bacterium]
MDRKRRSYDKLRIIPIGGLSFIGANCTAIEYGNDAIIIDAGMGFPSLDHLGVDYVIPNPRYMQQNAKKIKGLVITHGHLDHIGGIPKLIEPMGFPTIFASQFAKELILNKFDSDAKDIAHKVHVKTVTADETLRFGKITIEFFRVNHSIPESMGVIIRTPKGTIVHTGDYKFDNSPVNEPQADYAKIARVGAEEEVLCLMSDSTNSYREGHSLSESEIANRLEDVLAEVEGRVVVATFGSMVNRIVELLKIAQKLNRKVLISGRSMQVAIRIAQKIGYLDVPKTLFVKGNEIKKLPDNKVMILATGSQGEHLAALARMARNEHRDIKIKNGDTVILSASVIPGNGALVQALIDELYQLGADVIHNEIMNLHTTGHGHKEEQKLMINLVQPKLFMPIHGFKSFLMEHAKTAESMGIPKKNIIIAGDGDIIELDKFGWKKSGRVPAKPINVSGSLVGDVGNIILDDRQQLASYGVVVFELVIDKKTQKLMSSPRIQSRGFVYMKTSKELISKSLEIIGEEYEKNKKKGMDEIRDSVTKSLRKYYYSVTEREPMILGVITYL